MNTRWDPMRIFIGFDARETAAYHVACHSIVSRATCPVSITPLRREALSHIYWRRRGMTESTDFSLTRFLVPHLCGYQGRALFLDCDIVCLADIGELALEWDWSMNADKAVLVVKHDYVPKDATKFLGNAQTRYPRKNWSSVMYFDCARCAALTPEYVNSASGLDLHRFNWLRDDEIGSLPHGWNHLVGEYPSNPKAQILHFTLGGPWFKETRGCDHANLWFAECDAMLSTAQAVRY